jgi:DNA polymerase I-like protein with 3'-5' exonuclease and polymerase domains
MDNVYKRIRTKKEIDELIIHCRKSGMVAVDMETNGVYISRPWWKATTIAISFQAGSSWVVELGHPENPLKKHWKNTLYYVLNELFTIEGIVILVYNAMFERRIFKHFNIETGGRIWDVMLMKYLLDEERPNDLKSLVARLIPEYAGYDIGTSIGRKASEERVRDFWENYDLEELAEYNGLDTDLTYRLAIHLINRLLKTNLWKLFVNMYVPLTDILSGTVQSGVLVDVKYLESLQDKYTEIIEKTEMDLRSIPEVYDFEELYIQEKIDDYVFELKHEIKSGNLTDRQIEARETKISRIEAWEPQTKKEEKILSPLNFGSSNQLGLLLFSEDGLNLPILEYTKAGAPSTSEDTLIALQPKDETGFIEKLLELRGINKVYTTYVVNLLNEQVEQGRIHPTYLLHGTVTARLSSRSPNFQNIPRTTSDPYVKGMFYAPKGYYFAELDFSQAELRMVAIMSRDEAMLKTFKEGKNIHVNTAVLMFGEDYNVLNKARKDDTHPQHIEMVKKHKTAKVLNFAILYGMGPQKLSIALSNATKQKYSKQDAINFTEKWFNAFPGVKKWIDKVQKKAKQTGYSKNPFGFKRRLPILLNPDNKRSAGGEWNAAERVSVNAPIQGAASMLTQLVNIKFMEAISTGELPSYLRLVSTVHDSIEFYVHKTDIHLLYDFMIKTTHEISEAAMSYYDADVEGVYFKMSAEFGVRWSHMHEYKKDKDYVKAYDEEVDKFNNFCIDNELTNKDL